MLCCCFLKSQMITEQAQPRVLIDCVVFYLHGKLIVSRQVDAPSARC